MSNLAVVNFSAGGTLVVSGRTTFGSPLLSNSTASFQGITSTNLTITGTSTFNNFLPTSTQTPTSNSQLTTKIYVDAADSVLNSRITDTDAAQRVYVDASYTTLNTRITDTDAAQRVYVDASYTTLNTRITDTDAAQRIYIDNLGQRPIFYVNQTLSNTQTLASNTMTSVLFPESQYNLFTRYTNNEYLFRPTSYPGYYHLDATVCLPNITSGYIAIFKNGVEYSRGASFSSTTTSPNTTLSVSTIMYMNGSKFSDATDTDVRAICTPSVVISGGSSKTFFTGHFIQL